MQIDDIISYHDIVTAERASLQKGINYGVGKNYSVFAMLLRESVHYALDDQAMIRLLHLCAEMHISV